MGKRRRERDRPKAASDAPYNPNKRILLSYASDDEIDETEKEIADEHHPDALDSVPGDYQIAEYSDEDGMENKVAQVNVSQCSPKARPPKSRVKRCEEDDNQPAGSSSIWTRGCRRNLTTGQFPALGSTSYQWEEDEKNNYIDLNGPGASEDSDHDDLGKEAMAYLNSVRSQRQALPPVLHVSEPQSEEREEIGPENDTRGFFEEGAYVGRSSAGPSLPKEIPVSVDAQEAFTRSLKLRFAAQRVHLRTAASEKAVSVLDEDHPTTISLDDDAFCETWTRLMRSTVPMPAQIRTFNQSSVLRLLDLVRDKILLLNQDLNMPESAWIWSLLARLDDVGTMNNEIVSRIRELGKKAVLVELSLYNPAAAEQLEYGQILDYHNEDHMGVSTETKLDHLVGNMIERAQDNDVVYERGVEAAETTTSSGDDLKSKEIRENTSATLDMILIIVGDVFGQRDLLEFRRPWDEWENRHAFWAMQSPRFSVHLQHRKRLPQLDESKIANASGYGLAFIPDDIISHPAYACTYEHST